MMKKVITIVVLQATMLYYLISAGGCLSGGHGQDRSVAVPQVAALARNVADGAQLLIVQSLQVADISNTVQQYVDLQAENEGSVRSHNDMEAVPELRKAHELVSKANVVKREAEGVGEVCTQLMEAGLPLVVREAQNSQQFANLQAQHAENLDSLRSISQQLANLQIAHIANVFSLHRFVQRRYTQSQQFANLQAQHAENLDSVPSFTQQLAHLQAEHEQQIAQLYLAEEQIAQLDRVTQQLANLQLEHETRISELHQAVANSAGPSAWGNTQGSRSPDLSVAVCIVCTTLLTVIRMNSCPDGYTGA
ncbi:hypothetical protein SeLEV6574_g05325 [Synchytrium endobioticum]|uniref:Uncharacterized protein n=1 Tax=Synchytrium endobioticum TaxID=286115 RepID=A0A507CUV5_9FUNG|nr:hypothetical protein SeLEV6574_g05325 [Synchytrium endobioticum]